MLDVDRVWARQAGRFPGLQLTGFRLQVITSQYTIAASSTSQNQPVNFGALAIVIGILASASPTGQTALQTYRNPGMDLFTCSITYQADNRSVVGTSEAHGASVFGLYGDQFPGLELVMPQNTALVYNFTNLTSTSNILITLAHHVLIKGAVG